MFFKKSTSFHFCSLKKCYCFRAEQHNGNWGWRALWHVNADGGLGKGGGKELLFPEQLLSIPLPAPGEQGMRSQPSWGQLVAPTHVPPPMLLHSLTACTVNTVQKWSFTNNRGSCWVQTKSTKALLRIKAVSFVVVVVVFFYLTKYKFFHMGAADGIQTWGEMQGVEIPASTIIYI